MHPKELSKKLLLLILGHNFLNDIFNLGNFHCQSQKKIYNKNIQVENQFAHTKIKKIVFQIFCLVIVLWSNRKVQANFERKKINFYGPCVFYLYLLCIAKREMLNLPNFCNWTHKNIPDRQFSACFGKSQKSTLPWGYSWRVLPVESNSFKTFCRFSILLSIRHLDILP